jgi:hypothetical protein
MTRTDEYPKALVRSQVQPFTQVTKLPGSSLTRKRSEVQILQRPLANSHVRRLSASANFSNSLGRGRIGGRFLGRAPKRRVQRRPPALQHPPRRDARSGPGLSRYSRGRASPRRPSGSRCGRWPATPRVSKVMDARERFGNPHRPERGHPHLRAEQGGQIIPPSGPLNTSWLAADTRPGAWLGRRQRRGADAQPAPRLSSFAQPRDA